MTIRQSAAVGFLAAALTTACDHGGSASTSAPAASSSATAADATAAPGASSKPSSAKADRATVGHDATSSPAATDAGGAEATSSASANPAAPEPPALESFHGRGVFYANAVTTCPSVGVGVGAGGSPGEGHKDHACLRIGLDDEHSSAEIDRKKHRIVLRNDGTYKKEEIIADVILPGWSDSAKERAPISIHCVVRKHGKAYSTKVYAHVVNREKALKVEIEDLEIVLGDGATETVLVNAESARKVVEDPGISARVAGFLTEVKDTLPESAAGPEPHPIGDITISIGLGPAAKKALRAQLFRSGADTELRLTALSSLIPEYIVQRDLFLYGLEGATNLDEVKKHGFKTGDTMALVLRGGKGSVTFKGVTAELPGAASSLREFLTTAFVGMVLAHQAKLDAERAHP